MTVSGSDDVAVVVPTLRRPELVGRAVRSALQQTQPPAEVVVVIDGPDPDSERAVAALDDPRVHMLVLPVNGGAGRARNAGIAQARSSWIALLDDDDEWLPTKLEAQLRHVRQRRDDGAATVCATVADWRIDGETFAWPTRPIRPGESIAEYMFVRREAGEGLLALPTILLPRSLATARPFPEHLRTHEEWDWYLDLEAAGADWTVLMSPQAIVHAPRARTSVSTASTWRDSLAWAVARQDRLGPRAFADFCLTEVARSAKVSGEPRGVLIALRTAFLGRVALRSLVRFVGLAVLPSGLRQLLHAVRNRLRPSGIPRDRAARPSSARSDA